MDGSSRSGDPAGSGLSGDDWKAIRRVLSGFPEVQAVTLFGSRAKSCPTERSDIDLAVEGEMDELRVESIRSELEELPIPYRFDVLRLQSIRHQQLLDHIQRVGKRIYPVR